MVCYDRLWQMMISLTNSELLLEIWSQTLDLIELQKFESRFLPFATIVRPAIFSILSYVFNPLKKCVFQNIISNNLGIWFRKYNINCSTNIKVVKLLDGGWVRRYKLYQNKLSTSFIILCQRIDNMIKNCFEYISSL